MKVGFLFAGSCSVARQAAFPVVAESSLSPNSRPLSNLPAKQSSWQERSVFFGRADVVLFTHEKRRFSAFPFSISSSLPAELDKIVKGFQVVADPKMKYRQVLFLAKKLSGLPQEVKIPENKVQGCVSQVWIVGRMEDGKVYYEGESDSELTKGLAALLVTGLSGSTPEEIMAVTPEFITTLGLKATLTPSRNNGFLNMLKRMQRIAFELAGAENQAEADTESSNNTSSPSSETAHDVPEAKASEGDGTVYDTIERKLQAALDPIELTIIDESYQHAGHAGSRGYNGESHFRVEVVSAAFEGKGTVTRHRMVYDTLKDEMRNRIHALALSTKAPSELA